MSFAPPTSPHLGLQHVRWSVSRPVFALADVFDPAHLTRRSSLDLNYSREHSSSFSKVDDECVELSWLEKGCRQDDGGFFGASRSSPLTQNWKELQSLVINQRIQHLLTY